MAEDKDEAYPELPRVPADRNPWGVELLDLRPITDTLVATSSDRTMAENAVSYGREDGRAFLRSTRPDGPMTPANLRYPVQGTIADGVLFNPPDMDHKWALYVLEGRIVVVRSWQRRVLATAGIRYEGDEAVIGPIVGAFGNRTDPGFTVCALDFLLRTHALSEPWPVPELAPADPGAIPDFAQNNFAAWGRKAAVAAYAPFRFIRPRRPLRTFSWLHLAVARGDTAGVAAEIRGGRSPELRGNDGLTPLHWAVGLKQPSMIELLLGLGASADAGGDDGTTPLMTAVEAASIDGMRLLLDGGATPTVADRRGFTALHRAAESGNEALVEMLLAAGAETTAVANGLRPSDLAARQGHNALAVRLA